jgi:hypothetical protein
MKFGKRFGYLVVGLLVLLAACAAPMDDVPGLTETPVDLPAAVMEAQQFLAQELGVMVTEIAVLDTEQVDWPDACLGLAEEDEFCAQVVTPGWRVLAEVDGQIYELRTDETGTIVRTPENLDNQAPVE